MSNPSFSSALFSEASLCNYQIDNRFGLTGVGNIMIDDKNLLEKLLLDRVKGLFMYQN